MIEAMQLYALLTFASVRVHPSSTGAQVVLQHGQSGVAVSAYPSFCEIGVYMGNKNKHGTPIPSLRYFPWWRS